MKSLFSRPPIDSDEKVARYLRQARVPVIWLLGKAQSGKSSIVKALTGQREIEIGEGFRACTRASSLYAYPNTEAPLVRFLDTRGVGEAGYDPTDDIAVCEAQSHLLLVVVKISDHATEQLLDIVEAVRERHKRWPVIAAVTCLHETYPHGAGHPPRTRWLDGAVDLTYRQAYEHLERQKECFKRFGANVVPIDFTQPGDGFEPLCYGLEELVGAAESLLPEVSWNLIREVARYELSKTYLKGAQATILGYSLAAGSAAAMPVPFLDIPIVLAIHLKMLHSIAGLFEEELGRKRVMEIGGAIGFSFILKLAGRELAKLLPGGQLVSAAYAASITYGVGNAFCAYLSFIREGYTPRPDELRTLYERHVAKGRTLFEHLPRQGGR